ncbi:MAG TPA: hypothetical protein VJ813_09070 [Vicinamibacterales bacterium]|nr:hypothetical protein [Vicinamibacterales bacterium]
MFSRTLTQAGHIRRFTVSVRRAMGWEVRVEQDSEVVRQARYTDWHRLERAIGALEREMGELEAQGWRTTGSSGVTGGHQSTNL